MSDISTETSLLLREFHCNNIRLFFSEFVGSFLLLAFINGSSAIAILSAGPGGNPDNLYMALGSGFGLVVAVFCTFKISGGHVNPALSFALFTIRRIRFKTFLLYSVAQYLGAFFGSLCVFGIYNDLISKFDGGNETSLEFSIATAKIFSTFPNENVTLMTCSFDQVFATALLLFGALAITDERNLGMSIALQPVAYGILFTTILLGFGLNCGAALNPARDLSPRIATAICGWGVSVFSVRGYFWFWIPIVCPHIGAIFGAFIYKFTMDNFMQNQEYLSLSLNRPRFQANDLT